jgi:lipooligosaccharide transport system ATP-binding protein
VTSTPSVAVRAEGLRKSFGSLRAVDGVSFTIRRQECFGFLGPNGAGKTTTMRMLSCLARRDGGTLDVLGHDPSGDGRALKRRIGVVAQDITLDVELSVRENLLVYSRYFDIPRDEARERTEALLDFVQLRDRADDRVERLSGGMKRRIQIARALVNDPELVLLDEPTTGLDPQARRLVWDRLRALRDRGVTIAITTHYMEEAEKLCDRLVVMDHGRVVREGPPQTLIEREVGRHVAELRVLPDAADALAATLGPWVRLHRYHDGVLTVFGDDAQDLARLAADAAASSELQTIRPATLEDVFLTVTGHELRDD